MNKTSNAFDRLLDTFTTEYNAGALTGETLYNLAIAITFSVLNTAIDPQRKALAKSTDNAKNNATKSLYFNSRLLAIKSSIGRDMNTLARLSYALDNAYENRYDKNGYTVKVVVDKDLDKAVKPLLSYVIGEGMDIVHDCIDKLLREANEHSSDLQKVIELRMLDKRVYYRGDNSPKWKTVKTTPIQLVYRHVSECVRNSRINREVATNGYSYIEELVKDFDGNKLEVIYHRMKKYADLGAYEDSSEGLYTLGIDDLKKRDEAVKSMNLTKLQVQVLELRESGKGKNQIADTLGISENSVMSALREIRRKAGKAGIGAPLVEAKENWEKANAGKQEEEEKARKEEEARKAREKEEARKEREAKEKARKEREKTFEREELSHWNWWDEEAL